METLLISIIGLLLLVIVLQTLGFRPAPPAPPQIVYIQTKAQPDGSSEFGWVLLLLLLGLTVVALVYGVPVTP
jgi:hypothetical protein